MGGRDALNVVLFWPITHACLGEHVDFRSPPSTIKWIFHFSNSLLMVFAYGRTLDYLFIGFFDAVSLELEC